MTQVRIEYELTPRLLWKALADFENRLKFWLLPPLLLSGVLLLMPGAWQRGEWLWIALYVVTFFAAFVLPLWFWRSTRRSIQNYLASVGDPHISLSLSEKGLMWHWAGGDRHLTWEEFTPLRNGKFWHLILERKVAASLGLPEDERAIIIPQSALNPLAEHLLERGFLGEFDEKEGDYEETFS